MTEIQRAIERLTPMLALSDEVCCICGLIAIVRSFDGTGWCRPHLDDWCIFEANHRPEYPDLDATFRAWILNRRKEQEK